MDLGSSYIAETGIEVVVFALEGHCFQNSLVHRTDCVTAAKRVRTIQRLEMRSRYLPGANSEDKHRHINAG